MRLIKFVLLTICLFIIATYSSLLIDDLYVTVTRYVYVYGYTLSDFLLELYLFVTIINAAYCSLCLAKGCSAYLCKTETNTSQFSNRAGIISCVLWIVISVVYMLFIVITLLEMSGDVIFIWIFRYPDIHATYKQIGTMCLFGGSLCNLFTIYSIIKHNIKSIERLL